MITINFDTTVCFETGMSLQLFTVNVTLLKEIEETYYLKMTK